MDGLSAGPDGTAACTVVEVLATDPETGETAAEPVQALINHSGVHTMVAFALSNGSTLIATDGHLIWDATTDLFTKAADLHIGDRVQTSSSLPLTVTAISSHSEDLTAYNLQISTIHTYYAGATPILVHNMCASRLDDALATGHGQERLALRGFDSIDIAVARSSPTVYEQQDGALAHISPSRPGVFNVIVSDDNGIVTAMRGVTQNGLNNLAKRYGWSGYP